MESAYLRHLAIGRFEICLFFSKTFNFCTQPNSLSCFTHFTLQYLFTTLFFFSCDNISNFSVAQRKGDVKTAVTINCDFFFFF